MPRAECPRWQANQLSKLSAEVTLIAEARAHGDFHHAQLAVLQKLLRPQHSASQHVPVGRHADRSHEASREMGSGKAGACRELARDQCGVEVSIDVLLNVSKPPAR